MAEPGQRPRGPPGAPRATPGSPAEPLRGPSGRARSEPSALRPKTPDAPRTQPPGARLSPGEGAPPLPTVGAPPPRGPQRGSPRSPSAHPAGPPSRMHAALAAAAGPLLAALLAIARARPQPPDGGQCRPPRSQRDLNSFLWTIRRDPPAYLFGTIHVPYTRVWDFIPDNSKAAFQASARVYFELDLTDPYTISALASCQLLPHGENLQDVLPRELYWRLKRHLDYVKLMMPSWMTPAQRGKGLYADYLFNAIAGNWERKRPVWVMLMVNSLTETDVRSRGVPVLDLYLAQQAEKMRKSTGAVERVEEQCHPLNGLNFSQPLKLILSVFAPCGSLPPSSCWRQRNLTRHYGSMQALWLNSPCL
ncbi:metalloprotease TIKI2 [Suncus etruscus]|uniref:metalloprotease TIKI2 n=1 Tax=Suncus etruscus TaxID=109475 RepID=UPI00210F6EE4|nr:metalloprotease TIKI2 [Suncus etruscus]